MKDIYDSLEDCPVSVDLIDGDESDNVVARYHPNETEVIVHLTKGHDISFFINDLGLDDLLAKIIERKAKRYATAE